MLKQLESFMIFAASITGLLCFPGCSSAPVKTGQEVDPDVDPFRGGITSGDVRAVGKTMSTKILALPEIAGRDGVTLIRVADFSNNSRFMVDRNLFMKSLRIELNRYCEGKIRFFNSDGNVAAARKKMLGERQEEQLRKQIADLGKQIASLSIFKNTQTPIKIAVVPVLSTNLVNMNADSFAAMLRSEIADASNGKIQFLAPGVVKGADYLLTGQFYPESIRKEGIINAADYIEVINERLRKGQSLDVTDGSVPNPGSKTHSLNVDINRGGRSPKESALVSILTDPAMQNPGNVNQYLSLMLVRPSDNVSVWEKRVTVRRKITDNTAKADYILFGEISGLSQRKQGLSSDYLMITVQLTDPESNLTIMEDAYEVKRVSDAGIVYR